MSKEGRGKRGDKRHRQRLREREQSGEGRWEMVNSNQIQQPTPRHEKLRPDQTKKLQFVWDTMGPLCGAESYEQLDRNIRLDVLPDREITMMVAIAKAFAAFFEKHKKANPKEVSSALILASLGRPIFHKHAQDIESLLARNMVAEKLAFYREHGQDTFGLIGEDWSPGKDTN